mgnify:FL=1
MLTARPFLPLILLSLSLTGVAAAQASDSPLSIERMRARTYPGSALTTRQPLAPGANYQRRVVSYLSLIHI